VTGFAVLSVLLTFLTLTLSATVLLVDWLPDFLRRRRLAKRIRNGLERRPAPPPPGASNDEVLAYMSELFGDRTGSEIMDDEELRAELFRLAREGRAAHDSGVTAAG
jgi:hypothetical protein